MELIRINGDNALLPNDIEVQIVEYEKALKVIRDREEELKARLLAEMERLGIMKIETDDLTVTYIAPTDRETFDSKAFRKDQPDTYDQYVRMTPVKASIRIKIK